MQAFSLILWAPSALDQLFPLCAEAFQFHSVTFRGVEPIIYMT